MDIGGSTGTSFFGNPDSVELADEQWLEVSMAGTSSSADRPFDAVSYPLFQYIPDQPRLIGGGQGG